MEAAVMREPVRTKVDFYRRFYAGEFGNHGLMWSSLEDWRSSGYRLPIAIRVLQQAGRCDYNIPPEAVAERTQQFYEAGWMNLNWSAMAPLDCTTLQGEVSRTERGLTLFCSRLNGLPMRPALAQGGEHHCGLSALMLLRQACDPDSLDWINYLLDEYVDHVIEFTCMDCNWGVFPGRNTVIWEVRRY